MTMTLSVPVPSSLDLDEVAVKPTDDYVFWLNARPTVEGSVAKGLHVPVGNALVDPLAEQLGWTQYTVIHQDGAEKPYWKASPCSLIFLALNTQSPTELRQNEQRKGIAQAWGPVLDKETGRFKLNDKGEEAVAHRVKVRVFILELARLGYYDPFLLAVRGRITDSILNAANAAYRLSKSLIGSRRRMSDATPVYFYSVGVPIDAAVKPQTTGESTIYPVVPQLPTRMDDAFIQAQETPAELVDLIRTSGMLARAVEWSTEESRLIREGKHPEQLPSVRVSVSEEREGDAGAREVVEAEVREMPAVQRSQPARPPRPPRPAAPPVSEEEEEKAFAALFEEPEPEEASWKQELAALKKQFAQLYPRFSQSPDWWNTALDRMFPGRWESAASVNENDVTPNDLPVMRQKIAKLRASLQAKRAETGKGKATRS